MKILYFDIETDGLDRRKNKIHFVAVGNEEKEKILTPEKAVKILNEADLLIGHNILNFDIPVLQREFPEFQPKAVFDTFIASELIYSDLYITDSHAKYYHKLPPRLRGSHSLEAWGFRLNVLKDDFGKRTNWRLTSENKDAFEQYALQDIRVTRALYHYLKPKIDQFKYAFNLEQEVRRIITRQELYGFLFDKEKAQKLVEKLYERLIEIDEELQKAFPPKKVVVGRYKKPNSKKGIKAGDPKIQIVKFNPGSRLHIAERLYEKYGWKSPEITETGQPKINEEILSQLDFPEAKLLTEYLTIQKRLGQLVEGSQAYLKHVQDDGRIHGEVNTLGAVSRRMTHNNPNMAQVPNTHSPYGKEFRELFIVPEGKKLVGIDASGLELRCLAHYMARWDGGEYAKEIVQGDIHTKNQKAAGLPTRDLAKRFIYAFLYGAGNELLGSLVGGDASEGKKLRNKFLKKIPAIKKLQEAVTDKATRVGMIKSLYGVPLVVRQPHKALNLLLQSAGAIVMKQALVIFDQDLQAAGFVPGQDYEFVANVHDEWQLEVNEDIAEEVARIGVEAIKKAGEVLKFRCPLDGEAKIGNNWAETH